MSWPKHERLFTSLDGWLRQTDPTMVPFLRIGFALLLIIHTLVWIPDAGQWFTDAGVLTIDEVHRMVDIPRWSLFDLMPNTLLNARIGLGLLLGHSLLLLVGVASRWQALAIFLWLASIHHRNSMICDGEDTVMRLFAFFLIFLPLDRSWSLWQRWGFAKGQEHASAWALRLFQFEMILIYISAVICKAGSGSWQDGNVMYWVSRMTDLYGRLVPPQMFDELWMSRLVTWSALGVEAFLPLGLCWNRTRWFAILLGFGLHLGIEVSMNLFLFQWVMMLGLTTFIKGTDLRLPSLSWLRKPTAG